MAMTSIKRVEAATSQPDWLCERSGVESWRSTFVCRGIHSYSAARNTRFLVERYNAQGPVGGVVRARNLSLLGDTDRSIAPAEWWASIGTRSRQIPARSSPHAGERSLRHHSTGWSGCRCRGPVWCARGPDL